jgi:peptidoglycan/LPS O-acetylase OafA/YrhL
MHLVALAAYLILVPTAKQYAQLETWKLAIPHPFLVHSLVPCSSVYLPFNAVSWSVTTEFFFYLYFPLLVWQWRTCLAKLTGSLVAAMCKVYFAGHQLDRFPASVDIWGLVYISPIARMLEFTLGMVAAWLFRGFRPVGCLSAVTATSLELFAILFALGTVALNVMIGRQAGTKSYVTEAGGLWF